MVIFHKKWKKYNEIQLTKNKMNLNIRKITNHSPSLFPILDGQQGCTMKYITEQKYFLIECLYYSLIFLLP